MAEVLGHVEDYVAPCGVELVLVAGHVEAEEGIAVLKALGPLGPASGGVLAFDGDDGRSIAGFPALVEAQVFFCR
jgi:hypothetical protein